MDRIELASLFIGAGIGVFFSYLLHGLGFTVSYWKMALGLAMAGYILTATGLGSVLSGAGDAGDGGDGGDGDFFDGDGDGGDGD